MNIFKKRKKIDEGERILGSLHEGLKLGEENNDIEYMKKVLALTESGYNKIGDDTDFKSLKEKDDFFQKNSINRIKENIVFHQLMEKKQQRFELKQKKQLEEFKNRNKFWYRTKKTIRAKVSVFNEKMGEIWSFVKHEFLTIRKLMFFIYDLFFGKEYKNRKLFYGYKDQLIESNGYTKGEKRFNTIVRNITKSAELNKRILKTRG